jgi:hypothetical protein
VTTCASEEKGYALASVLFLVTILSVLCAIILRSELGERENVLKNIDNVKSRFASENGIVFSLASIQSQPNSDSTLSLTFDDGSGANVDIYPWGLFTGVRSQGFSRKVESIRSALLASSLTDSEKKAFVLGNLQHGLVFTGSAKINGDVATGPMGVSTGNLRNYSAPRSIPITGKKSTLSAAPFFIDTLTLSRYVLFIKTLVNHGRRFSASQDIPSNTIECNGSLNLRQISDSIEYIFCNGSLNIMDTIMRRGPPLYIVAQGAVSFGRNAFLSGPISICSKDSIVIQPDVSITSCILTSEKSILFQSRGSLQLFSPIIHFSSSAAANYPSVAASVSFADTSGTIQSIQLEDGSRVEGIVIMHRAASTSMEKAVITIGPGATVVGGICTDAYLTLDGTVDGYVRAFDLYFYDPPTTYLGWMRQGKIDRTLLPNGFLKAGGVSRDEMMKVLAWM